MHNKPVAFLVLFVVPLCSSAHSPAILSPLGSTVRTEQEHVRHETIIQPRKPGPEIWRRNIPDWRETPLWLQRLTWTVPRLYRVKINSTTFKKQTVFP